MIRELIASVSNTFKKHEQSLPSGDVAWSISSNIYTNSDFEKYNPDSLIGTKGHGIYKKMMQDEQVKAVVKFKRDAITSRDVIFEIPEGHNLSEEEIQNRINITKMYTDRMRGSWMDSLNGIMSAMYNGFSMTEKLYQQIEVQGKTWWGIQALKLKPFDSFVFKIDEYGNVVKNVQRVGGKEQDIDPRKFIKMVFNPDIDEHYGQSELREAYRAWFSKDMIVKFRNMWLERHAGGFRWISAKEGKTITAGSAEYTQLQNIIANINTSTGMILPSNLEMNSEYPQNNVAFKEAIDDNDMAIARSLLVPNLLGITPQSKTGSFAQSTTQLEAFFWTLEADTKRLEDVLNEELFRQLGEINFGDDFWPRLKFNQVSESKMIEIVKLWKDLVSGGAAIHTDSDESHIRTLLGFPEKGEEIITNQETPPAKPSDQIDTDNINPDDKQNIDDTDIEASKHGMDDDEKENKTVAGRGVVEVSAFSRAEKRIDFAVIDRNSTVITEEYVGKTSAIIGDIVADLIIKGKGGGELNEDISANIKKVRVDAKLNGKLKAINKASLKEFFALGQRHAETEIDKAKNNNFSLIVNRQRIDLIAEDFFNIRAFKAAGGLSDSAVTIVEKEILNGAKFDKSWPQVERAIYDTMMTKGLLSADEVKEALGDAFKDARNIQSPDARLRTMIRTNGFEAINEARYAYFTDPELGDFVQAFEYSAILDDRTTQICIHLDEDLAGSHSKQWWDQNQSFKPPNHFNCRSVLVPVTAVDVKTFIEGPQPQIEPQEGFK